MKEKKDLIKYEKNTIFKRIKNFFRGLFAKKLKEDKNDKQIDKQEKVSKLDTSKNFKDSISLTNTEKTTIKANRISNGNDTQKDKEDFFKFYEDFKNKKIDEEKISFKNLVRINRMLQEEIDMEIKDNNELEKMIVEDEINKNSREI